ncbi:MAG: hypothetical protein K1X33_05105 [Methanobacteriaceae archaeon]|nr:hypothetical protein [Methanobacteriaceae archaeon]
MSLHQNKKSESERFYKTLNRDILLEKQENGKYDLIMENDDYHITKSVDSLYNACIISCLTGFNEIGSRFNNETYTDFGNHAYELLKQNKSGLLIFKLEEYFKNVLNKIRRVSKVNELIISESIINPYAYNVYFKVTSIDDKTINGEFLLGEISKLITTNLFLESENRIIRSYDNKVKCRINDYRNRLIPNQVLNLFNDEKLLSIGLSNNNGEFNFNYTPNSFNPRTKLIAKYEGNDDYEGCISNSVELLIVLYNFSIVNGDLYYNYDTENYSPSFYIDDEGCLICEYDSDYIEGLNLNLDNNLYITIK